MKKIYILFSLLLISGCNITDKSTDINMNPDILPYPELLEDIVEKNGEIKNLERFEKYFNNVQQNKIDNIRLVRYTPEGNLMFYYLEYSDEIIYLKIDTHSNKVEQVGVFQTTCTSLVKVQTNNHEEYFLNGCEEPIDKSILVIEK